jgi:hypothetical protein
MPKNTELSIVKNVQFVDGIAPFIIFEKIREIELSAK